MGKDKLQRFKENETFALLHQPDFDTIFRRDFKLKGQWHKAFFHNNNPIVLELGCGKGEYTVALARKYPEKNFVGVDIKGSRMWVGATDALQNNLTNVAFLRTRIEFITSCFASGEVSEIWITFPDPQPQQSRANKRLTSARFLDSYKNILIPDGIIHLKTDSRSLFDYTCKVIKLNNLSELECTDDLYGSGYKDDILSVRTYYETMFMAKGFSIKYLKFNISPPNIFSREEEFFKEPDKEPTISIEKKS